MNTIRDAAMITAGGSAILAWLGWPIVRARMARTSFANGYARVEIAADAPTCRARRSQCWNASM